MSTTSIDIAAASPASADRVTPGSAKLQTGVGWRFRAAMSLG